MKSNPKLIVENEIVEMETLTYCKKENTRKETYPNCIK